MTLDPFYLIVDSADWLRRLVPIGLRLVQLRIKDLPPEALAAEIADAKAICARHGCTLVINDHWQLALQLGCDWVHLGQEDLDRADLNAIRAGGVKLGVSTHDDAELARAIAIAPDYIALGPVYPTILKQIPWAPQGLERLTDWKRRIGAIPLVAIGGLSVARAAGAFAAGADSCAAVTDITLNPDPEARVAEWLGATRGLV